MKKCLGVLLLVLIAGIINAQEERLFKVGCVAFYNVENLFDTIDDPEKNDAEFLPDGTYRWNEKRYWQKLEHLADVILGIGTEFTPDGPAILGLAEIENRAVIEDLINHQKLSSRKYEIIHYDSPDRRGVDVGMIYQPKYFKPSHSKSYTLRVEGMDNFFTRDQLVVSGLFDGEPMHFIVGHWPSRRGGEKRSLPLRVAAGKLSRHIVDSLLQLDQEAKIVIMGDLNDNPTNKSIIEALRAKGSRESLEKQDLYNPMYPLYRKGIGSNAWRDSWSLFDQLIVSQGLLGETYTTYQFRTAKVYNKVEMTQRSGRFKGYPWRTYVGSEYHGGYSDHFPVYLILVKEVQ